ncbi:MAG: hypothetical protein GXY83_27585 [Rhodopirellula sp.]|nr:hypothetical protein [Rhodopirellula sp.]
MSNRFSACSRREASWMRARSVWYVVVLRVVEDGLAARWSPPAELASGARSKSE